MSSRPPVADALASAVGFLGPAWKRAWAPMLATCALLAGLWAFRAPASPWRPEALAAVLLAVLMVRGGLYRVALGTGRPGPAGLQWGLAEWRLCAVWLLTAVFLFVLALLAFVVVLAFAFGVASSGQGFVLAAPATWAAAIDGRGRLVLGLVAGLVLGGLTWAASRVSLGSAASVARGRIQVLASWPDTRGMGARIVLASLILAAAPVGSAVAILGLSARAAEPAGAMMWAPGLAAGAIIGGFWLPCSVGLMAYFYRAVSGPEGRLAAE